MRSFIYVDRATGNHWSLTPGLHGPMLLSVNAVHSPGPGGFDDPTPVEGGFVARGRILCVRWHGPFIELGALAPEESRAAAALKSAACKTNQTVV
jgi:hypothetical protein